MKKLLLLGAAALLAAAPAIAQENLVYNPDFTGETTDMGQEQLQPEDWECSNSPWNGRITVKEFDAATDAELDPENVIGDLTNYLNISLYQWNSWHNEVAAQAIEFTSDATKYDLSYIFRANVTSVRASANGVNPVRLWVSVTPCDFSGKVEDGTEPVYLNEINWAEGDEWISTDWAKVNATVEVPAGTEYVRLEAGVYGTSGDDGQGGNGENQVYLNVTDFFFGEQGNDAVNMIGNAGNVVSSKYYDLNGAEVMNPAKGSFVIVKNVMDNGTVKVAKKVIR